MSASNPNVITVTTSRRHQRQLDPESLQRIADGLVKIFGPVIADEAIILHVEALNSRFLNDNEVLVAVEGRFSTSDRLNTLEAERIRNQMVDAIQDSLKFTDGTSCSIRWSNWVFVSFTEGGKKG